MPRRPKWETPSPRDSSDDVAAALLARAEERRRAATSVLDRLQLLERWARVGDPALVGSVAHGLVVARDIDLEISCARPLVEAGFDVVSGVAPLPGVWRVRFSNELEGPDAGLYWQIRFRDDSGDVWKIDMWLLGHDHPGPKAVDAVEPMRQALTDETRAAILGIKEGFAGRGDIRSIDVYRAVIEDGLRSTDEFLDWHEGNASSGLVHWRPRSDRETPRRPEAK